MDEDRWWTQLAFPDFGDGSCINCGFLAATRADRYPESEALQVPLDIRADPSGWTNLRYYCFANAANLGGEVSVLRKQEIDDAERRVFEKGRNCVHWLQWWIGFDPRWHFENYEMRATEASRRRFEQQLAATIESDRREWEARLERERREWQEEFDKKAGRFGTRLAIAAVALAVAEVIAAILALT